MRHFGGARLLALLLALVGPVPAFASHWIRVGSNGGPDNKILVDTDSLRKLGQFTLVDIMTVYPAPLVNSHDIELDRYVQRTAIDCERRTFVAVKTTGYLKDKPVGTSRELKDWRIMTVALPSDPTSNRIYELVCGRVAPTSSPKPR
ncbi:MAG: surface-adhesin E family protein [Steroidobacteraceae bacterium]